MKVIQSSLFRALCAIIVGALLIQYREQTVTWITIAIGVLFFLSGVFSLLSYMSAKRNAEKMKGQYLYDAQGNQILGMRPNFPLVGLGSLIFGLVLALMPNVFIAWLMFILSAILIMGGCLHSCCCWVCSPSSAHPPLPLPHYSLSDGQCWYMV